MLYRANIDLSLKLYAVIGVFEVILRNSIDRYMITKKGSMWLEDAIAPGGYLAINPGCERSFHSIQEAIQILGSQYCHDKLIANLSFGFWRHQFAGIEYTASKSNLLNIFINRPLGLDQKDIFKQLTQINVIRNRIAHHEPICFNGILISTEIVEDRYRSILELLSWLGCNPSKILYGIDKVPKSISFIKSI